MTDYAEARQAMVDCQLRPNEVNAPSIIKAMGTTQRELFVPKSKRAVAYVDEDIKINKGRFLMEPRVFGRLLVAADVQSTDLVLDVGPASGYSSAIMSQLADAVVAVESDEDLYQAAEEKLAALGAVNVAVVNSDMTKGLAKQGPYDVIMIGGMVDEIPNALIKQLKTGGRLVTVVNKGGFGRATLVVKTETGAETSILFDASVGPMPGFTKAETFVFA